MFMHNADQVLADRFPQARFVEQELTEGHRYLLVEESVFAVEFYAATFPTLEEVGEYHDTQDMPLDWPIVLVMDLVTGEEFDSVTEVTVETTFGGSK